MKGTCILLAAVATLGPAPPSVANDWYPTSCGTLDLCAEVVGVGWERPEDGASALVLSTALGPAAVREPFRVLDAGDGHLHLCMRYDAFGDLEVTCMLVPRRHW
jgi:hypothetical protein